MNLITMKLTPTYNAEKRILRNTHPLSFSIWCTYPDKAHPNTHGCVLSDGQWPRAVVMLGDFSFLLHCELFSLPSIFSPLQSLTLLPCCSKHQSDSHLNVFIHPRLPLQVSFLFPAFPWHAVSRPHPTRLLSPKGEVALFLAPVNSTLTDPAEDMHGFDPHYSVDNSSLIIQVFTHRGCLLEWVKICQVLKKTSNDWPSIHRQTEWMIRTGTVNQLIYQSIKRPLLFINSLFAFFYT